MIAALLSGAVGAVGLTVLHETARRVLADAPRADVLGERALTAGFRAADADPPTEPDLHRLALAGDLVANTAYYALVGLGPPEGAAVRGGLLGLLGGLGAVLLPGPLGLGQRPTGRTPQTALMTLAWYTAGGLLAGAAYQSTGADEIEPAR